MAVTGIVFAALAGVVARATPRKPATSPSTGPNGRLDPDLRLRADLVTDLVDALRNGTEEDRKLCHRAAVARTISMIAADPVARRQAELELEDVIRELVCLARGRKTINQSIVNRLEAINEQIINAETNAETKPA